MSDEESQKGHPDRSKVQRLPTDVAEMVDSVRRTLRLAEQQSKEDSPTTELDEPTRSNTAIVEAAIGLGLMLVGLSMLVVVSVLPAKAGSWLFIAAAVVAFFAGAARVDRGTREHRKVRGSGDDQVRRSGGHKASARSADSP